VNSFASLPLNPATLGNLERLGYLEMTAIQAASLPSALLGKDIIAQAREDAQDIVGEDPALVRHPKLAEAIDEYLNPEKEAFLERG